MKRIFTAGFNSAFLPYKYRIIEVARTDASDIIPATLWGDMGMNVGFLSDDLFEGPTNTTTIIEADSTVDNAARLAAAFVAGGKNDWYLPSLDELQLIYDNKTIIPALNTTTPYWCSSEVAGGKAPSLLMSNGTISNDFKAWYRGVRCIRAYYTNNLPNIGQAGAGQGIIIYIQELAEISHEINIYDRDEDGDDPDVLTLETPGYEVRWNTGTSDVISCGIIESECSIYIRNISDVLRSFLNSLVNAAEYRYIVEIKKNEKLWWFGILLPDFSGIEDLPNSSIELSAVDGLAYLNHIEASDINHVDEWIGETHTWDYLNDLKYMGVLGDILYGLKRLPTSDLFWKQTEAEDKETKFLYVHTEWFGEGMLETDEPMEKAFVMPYQGKVCWGTKSIETGYNGTEIEVITYQNYRDVIQHILTRFRAVLILQNGAWYIIQRECLISGSDITYHTYRREPLRQSPAVPDWTALPSTVSEKTYKSFSPTSERYRSAGNFNYLPGLLSAKVKYVAGDNMNTDSLVPWNYQPEVQYSTIPLEAGADNFLQIKVGFEQEFSSPAEFPECGFFRAIPRYRVYCKVGTKWWNGTAWQSAETYQLIEGTRLEYSAEMYNQGALFNETDPQDSGVETTLYGMHWTDINTGWVCGAQGVIRRTQNAGETTWAAVQSGVSVTLRAIQFPSFYIGYVVGYGGTILKTSNSGTFTQLNSGTTKNLNGVYFFNNTTGWVCGDDGLIRKTLNGGATWTTQVSGTTYALNSIHFIDTYKGWACGAHGTVLKTVDGGTTWTTENIGGYTIGLNSIRAHIYAEDGHTWVLCCGDDGYLFAFEQTMWGVIDLETDANLYNVWGYSDTYNPIQYLCGSNGAVFKTENNGGTWSELNVSTDEELYAVYFQPFNHQKGYVAGSTGFLSNTIDGGSTWMAQITDPGIIESLTGTQVTFEQNTIDIPENGVCLFKIMLHDFIFEYIQHGSTLTFIALPSITIDEGNHYLIYIKDNIGPVNWVEYEAINEHSEDYNVTYEEQDSMFGSAQTIYGNYITPTGAKWGKGFDSDMNLYFNQVLVEEIVQNQNHALLLFSGELHDRSNSQLVPIHALQFGFKGWQYRFFLNQISYNPVMESYSGDWIEISRTRLRISHQTSGGDVFVDIDLSPQTPTEKLPRFNLDILELNKIPRKKQLHVIPEGIHAVMIDEDGTLCKKTAEGVVSTYKQVDGCSIGQSVIGGVRTKVFIDETLAVPEFFQYKVDIEDFVVDGDVEVAGEMEITEETEGGSGTQVQTDWEQDDEEAVDFLKNKPTIPTKTSDITNDSNFIIDASYVHTDNNYSNTEKQKVADCEMMRDIMSDASKGIYFYDNFLYAKTATAVGQVGLSYYSLANSARSSISVLDTGFGKKRCLNLNTYTNAAGDSMVNALVSVVPSYGVMNFETRIKIPVLSAAAQRFVCYNGLQGGITSSPSDYMRFEYLDTLNSGKFLCSTCVGGVSSTADSLITVVADTWYILKIVSNSDASSMAFYINGNLVATITTNIPSAVDLHTVNQIIKSIGTTQRDLYVDFIKFYQKYN